MPQQSAGVKLSPAYILYGRKAREALFDDYLAREHIGGIKSRLFPGEEPAVSGYDADSCDLAEVVDELQTPPLWGPGRLVVVRGAEAFLAPPAAERAAFEPVMKRLAAAVSSRTLQGCLILVARALDVRGGAPRTSFKAAGELLDAVGKAGGLVSCVPPYENKLVSALTKRAREGGIKLASQAAELLVQLIGADQMALQEELDKLIAAASASGEITEGDVELLCARRRKASVFSLAEAILEHNAAEAMTQLAALRQSAATRSAPYLLAGMTASFRRYLAAAHLVAEGQQAASAAAAVGVAGFFRRGFALRLEGWTPVSLQALLDRSLQCDIEVKSGCVTQEIALETYVLDACSGRLETGALVGRWIHEV